MPIMHEFVRNPTDRRGLSRRGKPEVALFLCLTAGCGSTDGLNRQAVSGTVTLNGDPVANGAILFEPETERSGTAVGATIREGAFWISREQGPVPGAYRVRVYGSSGAQAPPAKGQTERTPRPMVERFPARYNARSELRAEVVVRSVNRYRFDLVSGKSLDVR